MECNLCKKQFSKHSNLRAHVKKFHPDKLNEIAPNKTYPSEAVCNACFKTFSRYSNLTSHVKKFHPDLLKDLTKLKHYNHKCEECGKQFTHLKHFKCHKSTHVKDNVRNTIECTLCRYKESSKMNLINHFREKHDITIKSQNLEFASYEEFMDWKSQMEKDSSSSFINQHGCYTTKNYTKTVFVCHRSGYYKRKGKGLRHIKTQGTNKVNGFCPAELSVKRFKDGKCEVKYITQHVGHDNDIGHLNLTKAEKQEIAVKIASKIPFQTILDQVRDSLSSDQLDRIHLLTKKDLYNIEQIFRLNNDSVRHSNDAISIESWVNHLGKDVLFYKPQDTCCEQYPTLKMEDFILIIMNEGQEDMLTRYSSDCICIDGTHGLNSYNFELTTLLVLDNMREGFPCTFLISSRSDEEIMFIFYSCLEEKIGIQLNPQVFMSDMADFFYKAWIRVMQPAKFRLYCTWHVDRAWRKNLTKIETKEKRVVVYKQLRTLLQERDINAFTPMLNHFITSLLSDIQTAEFGNYFKDFYSKNVSAWAFCYRLNSGLNTNMHIERMHRTIKYLYLDGKVVKRLDKAISAIMKFVRDKLFERLIIMNKGKISTKLRDLRNKHKTSVSLDINSVVEAELGWLVSSSSSHEIYFIEERKKCCDCTLVCLECETCIHRYTCTCLDSSIKWNMCKHIHLVCKFLKSSKTHQISHQDIDTENMLVINDQRLTKDEEKYKTTKILSTMNQTIHHDDDGTFEDEKEKIKNSIVNIIDKVTCVEELETLKKLLAPIEPTLAAVKQHRQNVNIRLGQKVEKDAPSNKNIETQRRLYSTKKMHKKKHSLQLKKVDSDEANAIALNLLKM